jgi:hypothetical protein
MLLDIVFGLIAWTIGSFVVALLFCAVLPDDSIAIQTGDCEPDPVIDMREGRQ